MLKVPHFAQKRVNSWSCHWFTVSVMFWSKWHHSLSSVMSTAVGIVVYRHSYVILKYHVWWTTGASNPVFFLEIQSLSIVFFFSSDLLTTVYHRMMSPGMTSMISHVGLILPLPQQFVNVENLKPEEWFLWSLIILCMFAVVKMFWGLLFPHTVYMCNWFTMQVTRQIFYPLSTYCSPSIYFL